MWVVVVGVIGIIVYSEMCGRVAAVAERPVFDLVRERVGFGAGLGTLVASQIVTPERPAVAIVRSSVPRAMDDRDAPAFSVRIGCRVARS